MEIARTLRALRRRMVMRQFLSRAARAALFFYAFLTTMTGLAWWTGALVPDVTAIPFMLSWPFVAGAIGALIATSLQVPPLRAVALVVDPIGGTRDRLLSALDFSTKQNPTGMERIAAEEAVAWLRTRDLRPLLPVRPPGELRWLVIPLATIALLWWSALDAIANRQAAVAAAADEVRGTLRQLEDVAKRLDARAADDEKARQIAARLRESAAQVRAEADRGGEANKAALRELAKLELLVKELRKPEFATPDELKALADALSQNDATRAAAKDIEAGNLANAARKLEQAAHDPAAAAEAGKTIQRALDHLARRNEQLSKQLEKLQQGAAGGREQLLQQIADALNELQQQNKLAQEKQQKGKDDPQQARGKPMTDDDLKKLLGALDRMKEQQQKGDGNERGEPREGEGEGGVKMLSFQKGQKPGNDDKGPQFPTGQPGGEKDEGTTKDPFGKEAAPAAEAGRPEQERARLAEGESLSALIPTAAAGDAKAQRRYKELTDAAASAAEDVVIREDIPVGARHLIRRYFEAIRPK